MKREVLPLMLLIVLLFHSSTLAAEAQPEPPNVDTLGPVIFSYESGSVAILSPLNSTILENPGQLNFTVEAYGLFGQFGNVGLSLDGGVIHSVTGFLNKTVVQSPDYWYLTSVMASVTLPSLSEGSHSATVYYGWQYLGIPENPSLERYEVSAHATVNFAVGDVSIVGVEDAGETLAASPHQILIESPNNHTVYGESLTLNVSLNFLKTDGIIAWQTLSSLNYSIDDEPPVNIINRTLNDVFLEPPFNSDNVTVSGLSDGVHKIAVTAVFVANIGDVFMPTYALASDPVYFTVNKESQPEPFPTTLLIGSLVAVAAVVGLGLLAYLKKRHRLKSA